MSSAKVAMRPRSPLMRPPSTAVTAATPPVMQPGIRDVAHEKMFALSTLAMSEAMDRSESSLQLVKKEAPCLIVSACGRSVPLQMGSAGISILALQSQLQQSLHMEGQTFQFFDVQGTALSTDMDVCNAVSGGLTPLCATLSDASIHYIENRREELAQMQWKLIRDQLTGATGKVAELNRRVQEMSEALTTSNRDNAASAERLRSELLTTVEGARESAKGDMLQLSERVNAVSQLLVKERNVREVSILGVEKQVQGARDTIEADRSLRRQEAAATCSQIEDVRQGVELESRAREAFEDRHTIDLIKANERMDEMQSQRNDDAQDNAHLLKKATLEANQLVEAQGRLMMQIRADVDSSLLSATSRLQQLEDRCSSHEGRLGESASRQMQGSERLSERIEKISQVVEQVRLGERTQGAGMLEFSDRVDQLEGAIKQSEADIREFCARERSSREQLMRSAQQSMAAEASLQVTAVKEELQLRLERESAARESSVQRMMEEVNAATADEDHKAPVSMSPSVFHLAQASSASIRARSPSSAMGPLGQIAESSAAARARSPAAPIVLGRPPHGSISMTGAPGRTLRPASTTLRPASTSRSVGMIPVPLTVAAPAQQAGSPPYASGASLPGPLSPVLQMATPLPRFSSGPMPSVC